jgi:hypothetical protein
MARISLLIALGFAAGLLLLPRLRTWAQAEPPKEVKEPERVGKPESPPCPKEADRPAPTTTRAPSAPVPDTIVAPGISLEPQIGPHPVEAIEPLKASTVPPPASQPAVSSPDALVGSGAATARVVPDTAPLPPVDELQKARETLKELAAAREKKSSELKDIEKLYAAAQAKLNEALQKRLKVLEQEANVLRAELKAQQVPAKAEEVAPAPQVITGSDSDEQ